MTSQKHKRDIVHPAFPQLADDTSLSRYTDLPKCLWMLTRRRLHLCRADLLGDPFEGSVPKRDHEKTIQSMVEAIKDLPPLDEVGSVFEVSDADAARQFAEQYRAQRLAFLRSCYVSCWRHGSESEAMWKLYCGPSEGVALVTTWARLKSSLTDPATRLGAIRYLDYNESFLPSRNALEPIMHKRRAFEHEQEVRVVRFLMDDVKIVIPPENATLGPTHREMEWNPEEAVDRIVVSPYAAEWHFELIRDLTKQFAPGLANSVRWSDLREDPVF